MVANKVRARAKETDGALRSVAWACLCYVQQGDRTWPDSEASILAVAGGAWPCERIEVQSPGWPDTREVAMAGMLIPPSAAEALKIAGLEFSKNPIDAPHVIARGNPSGIDTLEVVNGWLTAYGNLSIQK